MDYSRAEPPPLTRRDLAIPAAIFALALCLFWYSPISYMGDSLYSVLLTQNLLSKGSFVLDGYGIPHKPPVKIGAAVLDGDTYQIEIVDGHFYYYFPPGTSILSAPFVAVGDAFGKSVIRPNHTYSSLREESVQRALAALLMAILAVIFYFTARLLVPAGWSASIALGGVLGTQVWSTASRALWTHTWGVSLLGFAVYLLLAQETGRRKISAVALASVLSWSYFVRPTNSIFIIGITVHILLFHRALFLRYAATGAGWCAAFVAYSWYHFHHLLPSYYQAGRLETTHFWEALSGNLISPSRGTLLYVPVALFVVYLVLRHWTRLPHRRLVWLTLGVGAGHLAAVSCFNPWYGGWCFGPRYTTELVPWGVLLAGLGVRAAMSWREEYPGPGKVRAWNTMLTAGAALLLLSIAINGRGATVLSTSRWNQFPVGVDDEPGRVWDWRYPQALTGIVGRPLPAAFPVAPGRISFGNDGGKAFQLDGWSHSDDEYCWTEDHRASLVFATDDLSTDRLRMRFGPYIEGKKIRRQRIVIRLNGQPVASLTTTKPEPQDYDFALPAGALRHDNVLTFDLPDAASPASVTKSQDDRPLGIALHWMELAKGGTPP